MNGPNYGPSFNTKSNSGIKTNIWISNFKKCLKHPKISPRINLTVGAMNYPIMQQTLDYFYGLHVDPKEITYFPLKTPGVDVALSTTLKS